MANKNKLHDSIFWPILVLLVTGLIIFILTGCTDDCACHAPTLEDYETFHYTSYEKFYIPKTTLPDGQTLSGRYVEVYKFVYRNVHFIQFGSGDNRTIIPDPDYTTPVIPITAKPGATNSDYNAIFGKSF